MTHSNLTTAGPNLNGILDNHFVDIPLDNGLSPPSLLTPPPIDIHPDRANDDEEDDPDDDPLVDRIETEDGVVQDIRVYQIYLLGMSGTGKCSLIRQFKTTEYRGIYEYSGSVGKSGREKEDKIAKGNGLDIQMLRKEKNTRKNHYQSARSGEINRFDGTGRG